MGRNRRRYEFAGWLLFAAGIVAFLVQGLRSGDVLTVVGSVLFLLGVAVFLAPYVWRD